MDSDIGKQVAEKYLAHFGTEEYDILKTEPMSDEDLAQSGILGMKWGIRRTREALARLGGRLSGKGKKKTSDAPIATRQKRLSELTDSELNTVIARLQKEKLYKDLVNPPGSSNKQNPVVQKGESIVHKMLSSFGTSIASKFAEGAGTYLANKFTAPRQVKVNANAENDKARYALRNQKLEEKRREKAYPVEGKHLVKTKSERKAAELERLREKGRKMWEGG